MSLVAPPGRARFPTRILAGFCVLFAVWILVLPPFAGSDEFDHAYRAAAAARGEWLIHPTDATRGSGAFLRVPKDIVEAAYAECHAKSYTSPSDCVGRPDGPDRIVSSGAGRYHPLFYAVIGTAALPFHGAAALYAMRCATALLCLAFVAAALLATGSWARTSWPFVGVVLACTPVAVYSATVASPNGLEMMAALALWTSLVGLLRAGLSSGRMLVWVATASAATLATLRPLGPWWCAVVLVAVLLAVTPSGAGRLRTLWGRTDVRVGLAVVAVSVAQSTVWVLATGALQVGFEGPFHKTLGERLSLVTSQVPAWILQSIAAFPLRDDATHPAVYACYLVLFVMALVLGLRGAGHRLRAGLVAVGVVGLLFPFVTSVQTYNQHSVAWQGRYGLPLTMGMMVLAGLALDLRERAAPPVPRWVMVGLFVVAEAVSPLYTQLHEQRVSPQAGDPSWVHLPVAAVAVLATAASLLVIDGAFRTARRD